MRSFKQWFAPKKSSKSKNSNSLDQLLEEMTDVQARKAKEEVAVARSMTIDMIIEKETSSKSHQ